MPRIKFKRNFQAKFLLDVQRISGLSWPDLAKELKVHKRTLSDWRREQYTISENAFQKCLELTKHKVSVVPGSYKVLSDFWSVKKAARKAGLIVAQKYGGPGTPEGRRKGGLNSQRMRRLHPELYRHCIIRKRIIIPPNTSELAEFLGIVLGDGGIGSNYQVVITLHKDNAREYVAFVCDLIKKLFGITAAVYSYHSSRSKKVLGVVISSAAVVEFLLSKGLKKGNKVRQQVEVPIWIRKNIEFSKSCLRGLIDTDGCVYDHRHVAHSYKCYNIGLQFVNKSVPLLKFVTQTLSRLSFSPKLYKRSVGLFRENEVWKYASEIKFHNLYHIGRLKKFFGKKFPGRGAPNW